MKLRNYKNYLKLQWRDKIGYWFLSRNGDILFKLNLPLDCIIDFQKQKDKFYLQFETINGKTITLSLNRVSKDSKWGKRYYELRDCQEINIWELKDWYLEKRDPEELYSVI